MQFRLSAESIAEKNQQCGTAEIERGTALGEQLSEEEYEALKEIRVHNTAVRQQRTEKKEEKPRQKGGTDSKGRPENGGTDSKGRPGNDGGNEQAKKFPSHWGKPPAKQTKDRVKLPGNFGFGSSVLARWIEEHMEADAKKRQEKCGNE